MTNNEAEYEAMVAGLNLVKAAGAENMIVHYDSQVITSQINSDYECRNERMKKYLEEVKYRIDGFEVRIIQIPMEENKCVNCLAKAAFTEFMIASEQVLSFIQITSLINNGANVQEINFEKNWTTPLVAYLRPGILLDRKDAARKLKVQASQFVLIRNVLYKRGFS